jgi:hypothetical protein
MTAMMRQIRKQTLTLAIALLAGFVLAGLPAAGAHAAGPAIVTDPLTGVALDGFDPVSYFTEPAPLEGLPDYEYDWEGIPWYFASAANRDVFIRAPEVYAPQFGGHATTALSQGYLSDGNPQIFTIAASRLYLFYSTDTRDAFVAHPAAVLKAAMREWSRRTGATVADVAPVAPPSPPDHSP